MLPEAALEIHLGISLRISAGVSVKAWVKPLFMHLFYVLNKKRKSYYLRINIVPKKM